MRRSKDLLLPLVAGAALALAGAPMASAERLKVTSTKDKGAGSLRGALEQADSTPGRDRIVFRIGGGGRRVRTIRLAQPLPPIARPVTIDGTTQGPRREGRRRMLVVLAGGGTVTSGLVLTGNRSTVRGLALHGFTRDAIRIEGGDRNAVEGTFVGTNAAGTAHRGNAGAGIRVLEGARRNRIGGRGAARNVLSGNAEAGVVIEGGGTDGNAVRHNAIGPGVGGRALDGDEDRRQDTGVIVRLDARFNRIGAAPRAGARRGGNLIAFNEDDGVLIGGTARAATDRTDANPIRRNSIHSNGGRDGVGLGINFDSGIQGVPGPGEGGLGFPQPFALDMTMNDPLDVDTGPNNEQNHPELTAVTVQGATTRVTGRLTAEPRATYLLDVYENRTVQPFADGRPCDPSRIGEGEIHRGVVVATTDETGETTFEARLRGVRTGSVLTATATKTDGGDREQQPPPATGEFSPCVDVRG